MGVYQEWEAELYVPKDALDAIMSEIEKQELWKNVWIERTPENKSIDDLASLIVDAEGSDWDEPLNITETDDKKAYRLLGGSYGKINTWINELVESILAANGVTGSIEWECEGERGKTVFEDGAAKGYGDLGHYSDENYVIATDVIESLELILAAPDLGMTDVQKREVRTRLLDAITNKTA